MPSKSETVLLALRALLEPLAGAFERNTVIPTRVPPRGLIILRDGDPGQPEVTLSPMTYHYEHAAEIEVFVQAGKENNDAAFDTLRQAIGAAILADRTLGSTCDWVEPSAPQAIELPGEDSVTVKAATIPVMLTYSTSTPL